MAAGTALKIGSQVIKHAPKLRKLKKLGPLQKVLSNVKSSKNVIQKKLNTKKRLAKIGEEIKDLKNINTIRKLNKAIDSSTGAIRNTPWAKRASLNKMLFNQYMGGMGPKDMIRNLSKAKGLSKLSAGARFIGPVFELLELKDATGKMLQRNYKEPIERGDPDNSLLNNIRNLATNAKHFNNRDKFLRTKMAGEADQKYNIPFTGAKWNPFDDTSAIRPNAAKMHNMRADSLAKWDKRAEGKTKEEE